MLRSSGGRQAPVEEGQEDQEARGKPGRGGRRGGVKVL